MNPSFEEILSTELYKAGARPKAGPDGACCDAKGRVCTVCHASAAEYVMEREARSKALAAFWRTQKSRSTLEVLRPSPQGREYRTVTKRKVFTIGRKAVLGLIARGPDGRSHPMPVQRCLIEPVAHAAIYRVVQDKLAKPYATPLAAVLRHVVVKGGESEQTVLFTVGETDRDSSHALNTLSKSLTHELPSVVGVYLYLDESRGTHFLGTRNPHKQPVFRRIFGKGEVYETVGTRPFLYHPLSFSQVNPAVSERIAEAIAVRLDPQPTDFLYDFYCGYGLFTLLLAPRVQGAVGVELSPFSVESAIANARRHGCANARFRRGDITAELVQKTMERSTAADIVILDPPRGGTAPGVIESIAVRQPRRVAHLVCNIELLAAECKRWERNGYTIASLTPFDMFPGTDEVEVLAVFHASPAARVRGDAEFKVDSQR